MGRGGRAMGRGGRAMGRRGRPLGRGEGVMGGRGERAIGRGQGMIGSRGELAIGRVCATMEVEDMTDGGGDQLAASEGVPPEAVVEVSLVRHVRGALLASSLPLVVAFPRAIERARFFLGHPVDVSRFY